MPYMIGEASCEMETVRYYDQVDSLPEPVRTRDNLQLYSGAHVE